jgi:hypothetical protein
MTSLKNVFIVCFALLAIGFISSCGDDEDPVGPTPTCDTEDVTYNNFAKDLFDNNCSNAGCHNAGTTTNFPLSTYDEAVTAVGFGRMLGAVNRTAGFSAMPRGADMLDDCTIEKLEAWIDNGTPE